MGHPVCTYCALPGETRNAWPKKIKVSRMENVCAWLLSIYRGYCRKKISAQSDLPALRYRLFCNFLKISYFFSKQKFCKRYNLFVCHNRKKHLIHFLFYSSSSTKLFFDRPKILTQVKVMVF